MHTSGAGGAEHEHAQGGGGKLQGERGEQRAGGRRPGGRRRALAGGQGARRAAGKLQPGTNRTAQAVKRRARERKRAGPTVLGTRTTPDSQRRPSSQPLPHPSGPHLYSKCTRLPSQLSRSGGSWGPLGRPPEGSGGVGGWRRGRSCCRDRS